MVLGNGRTESTPGRLKSAFEGSIEGFFLHASATIQFIYSWCMSTVHCHCRSLYWVLGEVSSIEKEVIYDGHYRSNRAR